MFLPSTDKRQPPSKNPIVSQDCWSPEQGVLEELLHEFVTDLKKELNRLRAYGCLFTEDLEARSTGDKNYSIIKYQ